jgi:4-hydroxy-2-oxoheptanedioate aldolase
VCRFVRAAKYSGRERSAYFQKANQALVIVQVEGLKGIENLEAILAVQGIDIVLIGPYNLSQARGVTGQVDHPVVQGKMKDVVTAAGKKNIVVGTFVDTIENALNMEGNGSPVPLLFRGRGYFL